MHGDPSTKRRNSLLNTGTVYPFKRPVSIIAWDETLHNPQQKPAGSKSGDGHAAEQ